MKPVPDSEVARIYADYRRLGSLEQTGKVHGRAGATIWALLNRRGLIKSGRPAESLIGQMYRDYCSGLSLAKVGDRYGRTRQTVFQLFQVRGLKLRAKKFLPAIEYKGRKFTSQKICGKHRYLRCTVGRGKGAHARKEAYLHHVIWQEHRGPIPPGHKVCFKDGNHFNCAIENLELLSNSEQPRKHATGANQFTLSAKSRLGLLMRNFESGERTLSAQLKRKAA
jgi:hypothetical protein